MKALLDRSIHLFPLLRSPFFPLSFPSLSLQCLDRLPGNDRTQVGFVTFDSSVHFYSLKATLSKPQQLVVADLSEQLFMPVPDVSSMVLRRQR